MSAAHEADGLWPVARWEGALAEPVRLWEEVAQEVLEGKSLRRIARERGYPVLVFRAWVAESAERAGEYERLLRVRADELVAEALEIADAQKEAERAGGGTYDPEVPRDKLRVDTRLKLASKWDRERYGDQVRHDVALVDLSEVLRRISERKRLASVQAQISVVQDNQGEQHDDEHFRQGQEGSEQDTDAPHEKREDAAQVIPAAHGWI